MDLDEIIFTRFTKYFKKRSIANDPLAARRVMLDDIKPKLTIMSRALTGKNIEIFAAEQEGGYRDNNFFLPHSMDFFGDATENLKFYFFRIVYLVIQQNKNLNWQHDQKENTLQEARLKAASSAPEILDSMLSAYPIVIGIYKQLYDQLAENCKNTKADPDTFWLYGKWMKNQYEDNFNEKIKNISEAKPLEKNKVNPATLLKAKAIEEIKSIQVDKKQQEDYVLTHNFEKVETAEEFNGTWRDFDGDDQLEDHHEAIEELSMKLTVRVDDPVHSVYQAEFIENSSVAESVDKPDERYNILYPEWDYTRKSYKQDFCAVYPTLSKDMNANYYEQTIRNYKSVLLAMRKLLTNYSNKRKHIRSQPDGPEFDIDAITDLYVDVHSGKTPSERIYLSSQKKDKDLSILLLLDTSLSSDGYADGNRVIDVEKQVSLLFGEILNEFRVDFAVSDFHSSTRNFLSFRMLKDFDESWQSGKFKIGAAEPSGYTRIGGALRHATHLLKNRHTTNKWVILLSDGKPNDYDKYEGRYGIQDVRQALREALEYGINSYALAIEAQARYYLPQMFGQNHYQILSSPVELLSSMVRLFEKIHHK